MKLAPSLTPLLFVLACSSEKAEQTDTVQEPETAGVVDPPACYSSVMGQDTMLLRVENRGGAVTGNLSYNFYEKDDSEGTLRGKMHGDTLMADYIFQSEGTTSTQQVVFLQKDGGFVEGYGDMEDRNGKMVFKNTALLNFESGTVYKKVPCED